MPIIQTIFLNCVLHLGLYCRHGRSFWLPVCNGYFFFLKPPTKVHMNGVIGMCHSHREDASSVSTLEQLMDIYIMYVMTPFALGL